MRKKTMIDKNLEKASIITKAVLLKRYLEGMCP